MNTVTHFDLLCLAEVVVLKINRTLAMFLAYTVYHYESVHISVLDSVQSLLKALQFYST